MRFYICKCWIIKEEKSKIKKGTSTFSADKNVGDGGKNLLCTIPGQHFTEAAFTAVTAGSLLSPSASRTWGMRTFCKLFRKTLDEQKLFFILNRFYSRRKSFLQPDTAITMSHNGDELLRVSHSFSFLPQNILGKNQKVTFLFLTRPLNIFFYRVFI